jgi:hypothetical protein
LDPGRAVAGIDPPRERLAPLGARQLPRGLPATTTRYPARASATKRLEAAFARCVAAPAFACLEALKRPEKAHGSDRAAPRVRRRCLETRSFAGLSWMARPVAEPGTPRFSAVARNLSNSDETPAFSRFLRRRDQQLDRRKLRSFVADWALECASVPNAPAMTRARRGRPARPSQFLPSLLAHAGPRAASATESPRRSPPLTAPPGTRSSMPMRRGGRLGARRVPDRGRAPATCARAR